MSNIKPHFQRMFKQVFLAPLKGVWIAPLLLFLLVPSSFLTMIIVPSFLISLTIGIGHSVVFLGLLGRLYKTYFIRQSALQIFSRLFIGYQLSFWIPTWIVLEVTRYNGDILIVCFLAWLQANIVFWLLCKGYVKDRDRLTNHYDADAA